MAIANTNSLPRTQSPLAREIVSDSLAFGVLFAIALTIIQRFVGFLRGILFCRYMTEQELGQWSMVFSFLMLLAPLAVLGLPGSFGRFVEHYKKRSQLGTFIRRIAKISCVMTLLLAGTMYVIPTTFSEIFFRSPSHVKIIHSMAFAIVLVTTSNFLTSLMESLRQVRSATLMRFIQGVSFAVFGCLLIAGWEDAAAAATFGFGLACLCSCFPALWFLWKYQLGLADSGEKLRHTDMWRRITPYAIWTWACNLVWNMFEVADRYMLVHWTNASADQAHGFVGQYHSGRVVPLLLVGVAVVLNGMLMPFMTALWEKKRPDEAAKQVAFSMKLMAIGFTVCSIAILVLSPLLFNVVLQGRYADGLAVLPLTLVYSTWFSMFLIGQIYLWVAERGSYVFFVTSAGLAVNLLLNGFLIPSFELWGAVIATSTATLFCLILTNASNQLAGFRVDRRIWIASLFPVVIMLPMSILISVTLLFVFVACRTNLVFDSFEKGLTATQFQILRAKLNLDSNGA